jgi:hypothetical protein
LFSAARKQKRLGEASVWYLYSQQAAEQIKEFSPSARIIAMLRNPVDMMYSYYCQAFYFWSRVYKGCEDLPSFEEALSAERGRKMGSRLPKNGPPGVTHFYYLYYRDMPQYARQIQRYVTTFGRERIHVIIFDDFKKDPAAVYRDACKFLDVDPRFQPALETVNETKCVRYSRLVKFALYPPPVLRAIGKRAVPRNLWRRFLPRLLDWAIRSERPPEMDSALRKRLQAEFLPEVEKVSQMLNRDLTYWCRN